MQPEFAGSGGAAAMLGGVTTVLCGDTCLEVGGATRVPPREEYTV